MTVIDVTIFRSQAEYLQSLLPESVVVKAFNVLSAYSLESGGLQGSREVLMAGDDEEGKSVVRDVVRTCGFTPVDMGALRAAREVEDIPVRRFEEWKTPLIISVAFFVVIYLLGFAKYEEVFPGEDFNLAFRDQFCWTLTWQHKDIPVGEWHWNRWHFLPMSRVNKTLSVHALTLLSLCYLPGVIAAWLQIVRGTKYSRFPNWLDKWLKMRKQIGLLMLFSASIHVRIS